MTVIRVNEDTSREDLIEALAGINDRAKRIPHVLGTPDLPTEWDRRHEASGELLELIELEQRFIEQPPVA